MSARRSSTSAGIKFSTQSVLQKQFEPVDTIWEKLKCRAEQLDYGSLSCELQVHGGQIRQVDITVVKERFRAD
jgi:hypothetical protein